MNNVNLTKRMGEAQAPPLRCLIDKFVELIPPTTTMQQKGHCVRNGKSWTYTKKAVKGAMAMYRNAFYPYRLKEPVVETVLFARIYIYWEPPKIKARKMGFQEIVLKPTKPDTDNAEKLFIDSVGDLFFDDDRWIVQTETQKAWCKVSGVYFGLWKVIES